jgi:glutaredoxin-like protein NrdH
MSVTVYTLPTCVQCDMTKKYLDKYKIDYTVVDLSQDLQAAKVVADLGYKQAPVVIHNNFHWSGFRPDKISALRLLLMDKGIKDAQ